MYPRDLQQHHFIRQKGFLIPLALFIIVGLSLLAISISRLATQSSNSAFREMLSAQTFYAADSGVQYTFNQILFPNASRTTATAACSSINGTSLNFNVTGLSQCQTDISCSAQINDADTVSFFSVVSFATCGAGELTTERVVQAKAYLE